MLLTPSQALQFSMPKISSCEVPESSLLARYVGNGGYTDVYTINVPGIFSQQQFVNAFYTSRLFRIERAILSWIAGRPSTDTDVNALAGGRSNTFAVWSVEARIENELLLKDITGKTRSWLHAAAVDGMLPGGTGLGGTESSSTASSSTMLFFGSAVMPRVNPTTG